MSEDRKPQNLQDQRLKPMQGENPNQQQQQHQHHQPQKCPRCESLNTKFCYYNNYSLSQPRYFCKTCRRYWTQGGTLRNVPVGGGCRKGKRTKTSASGENSRSSQPTAAAQQVQQNFTNPQSFLSSNPVITTGSVLRTNNESGNLATPSSISSMGSYYPSGGFLSSLAAIQPLNHPQSFNHQPLNQALSVGDGDQMGGSSLNLGLLQGYGVPSFGSSTQQHHIQETQFYQMGNRDKIVNPMYHPSDESLVQSSRPGISSRHDWNQSFINSANPNVSDTALWSISSSSSGNTNTNTVSGSLNPNQWPDLAGYGPPS